MFTTMIGTPLDDRRILKEFVSLLRAAKLPKQRFHDLRHACVSLLHAQGVPDKKIAETVGHSDVRLTQAVDQHVFEAGKQEAARKMDALLLRTRLLPIRPQRLQLIGKLFRIWSHPPGLNRRPADYESAALPAELGWLVLLTFYSMAAAARARWPAGDFARAIGLSRDGRRSR